MENTAYLAYVNLVGVEDGLQFWGGSRLVGPTGDIVAKAKYDEEDFVLCEVDLQDMRPAEAFIPTLRDLRPELFDELKKSCERSRATMTGKSARKFNALIPPFHHKSLLVAM